MAEVTMPRLSDTMEEGTIASWLKKPGEQVNKGDVIAQIETYEATMDLTAFEAGTLQEILAPEGTTVAIGQPVARIGSGASPAKTTASANAAEPPQPSEPPSQQELISQDDLSPRKEPSRKEEEVSSETSSPPRTDGKTRASPMARHIA